MVEHRVTIRLTDEEEAFCKYAADAEGFDSSIFYIRSVLENAIYNELNVAIKDGFWQKGEQGGK